MELNKRASLIDEDGYVVAFYDYKSNSSSIEGNIYSIHSWEEDGSPYESSFFAYAYIKWDSCSHFRFYGEDYDVDTKEEKDGYYHVCGVGSYLNYMCYMHFALEVMNAEGFYTDPSEDDDLGRLRNLNLLKGYEIRYENL